MATTYEIHNIESGYLNRYDRVVKDCPRIIVINGVTGVGKTSVAEQLARSNSSFKVMRNFTTRETRDQDNDPEYYLFGDLGDFRRYERDNDVLCSVTWPANRQTYAILKSELGRFRAADTLVYTTTHFGYALKSQNPYNVLNIWLTCQDPEVLKNRLLGRGTETSEENKRRYALAVREQDFILKNTQRLVKQGKIDYIIDTSIKSSDSVVDELKTILRFATKLIPGNSTVRPVPSLPTRAMLPLWPHVNSSQILSPKMTIDRV